MDLFDYGVEQIEPPSRTEPTETILRPYQLQAVDGMTEALNQYDSTLLVMPTGSGKTITLANFIARHNGERVLWLAHRQELIDQAAREIRRVTGRKTAIEMGEEWADRGVGMADVIVSSIQTQIAGQAGKGRMTRFDPSEFSLVIIDEAHHAPSNSYRRVIDYYRQNANLKVIGCTATPDRHDEAAMGQIFESVAFDYEISDAINDGWLVPIHQTSIRVEGLDFSGMRTTAGDLNGADLDKVMRFEAVLHGISSPTVEIAGNRKTLCFSASVAHAERLSEIFNRHRPDKSRYIYAKTPKLERRAIFEDYHASAFQFLCNCGIVTEGVDVPSIQVVSVARPTKSRALYAQMVGRGTRPLPGLVDGWDHADQRKAAIANSPKPYVEVLDFVGNAGRHKLMSCADILGGNYSDDVVEKAARLAQEESEREQKPSDVAAKLEEAKALIAERRRQLDQKQRQIIKARATYRSINVDPFGVYGMEPTHLRGWDKDHPPTGKQVDLIMKMTKGRVNAQKMNRKHASQLITKLITRSKEGMATYGQTQLLHKYGLPTDVKFEQARKIIDVLAASRWKGISASQVNGILGQ